MSQSRQNEGHPVTLFKCSIVVTAFVWIACTSYHLDDVIVGTISFLLVRIKLKQMELAIVRNEFADNGSGLSDGDAVVTSYLQIVDKHSQCRLLTVQVYMHTHSAANT